MITKTEIFNKAQLKKEIPNIRPGDTIRVFQKIQEKEKGKKKRKVQSFEGIIIAKKHGKGISATITVRKVISGVGVEKIFPIHSPMIQKIEILKRAKVRRAKLYYLRTAKGKKARLKRKDLAEAIVWEEPSKALRVIKRTRKKNPQRKSLGNKTRTWRNWYTHRIEDPGRLFSVWVQVPPSAQSIRVHPTIRSGAQSNG